MNPHDIELPPWLHGQHVNVNCFALNHPLEVLEQYKGKFVAWTMDGTRVLASGDSMGDLFDATKRLGLTGEDHIVDYIPTAEDFAFVRTVTFPL